MTEMRRPTVCFADASNFWSSGTSTRAEFENDDTICGVVSHRHQRPPHHHHHRRDDPSRSFSCQPQSSDHRHLKATLTTLGRIPTSFLFLQFHLLDDLKDHPPNSTRRIEQRAQPKTVQIEDHGLPIWLFQLNMRDGSTRHLPTRRHRPRRGANMLQSQR